MKFTARRIEENVNVSKTHPLAELLWLIGGLLLMAGTVFLLLGLSADWAASKAPVAIESRLGALALNNFTATPSPALQSRLNALLERVPADSPLHRYDFHIYRSDVDEVNALALPGGNILVFSGLLSRLESENELSMVLAHELGHFAHRDHLRGLGRGLGAAVAVNLLLGPDSAAGSLISKAFLSFQVKYSQTQESAADRFAVDLLNERYGHVGGATTFFSRLAQNAGSRVPYILASHPHPLDRIAAMKRRIASRNYSVNATAPLSLDLQEPNSPVKP